MPAKRKIVVIGLGYVGLPLAVEFSKKYATVGFDISAKRIEELKTGNDRTLEITKEDLLGVLKQGNSDTDGLFISSEAEDLKDASIYIVTVPTPVDKYNKPDLKPLYKASETVGKVLKKGDIVIYESTVYPGATEEDCVPVLEAMSGLVFNQDFFAGYSPERINPGDKEHTVTKIKKVTSGSTPETAKQVNDLYASIITAGTHLAPSIKVAEAAKVIENSQRDINIAFVNELAQIFSLLNIDTSDVLEAAATKWNFLKFRPGLVGGHCISVDPYYLAHKAVEAGYHPQVILSGRRVNDQMGQFIASKVVKLMIGKDHKIKNSKVLILGITFKENCPDVRNTKVIDIYNELQQFGLNVDVYDPWANAQEVFNEYGITLLEEIDENIEYAGVVLAVAHEQFGDSVLKKVKSGNAVVFDAKAFINRNDVDARL